MTFPYFVPAIILLAVPTWFPGQETIGIILIAAAAIRTIYVQYVQQTYLEAIAKKEDK